MNILKSLAVKDIEEATRAIPVIDFSPAFRSPADPEGLEAVAREVRHASETVGFFYLAGHGVPDAVVEGAFAASREFHRMPLDEKLRLQLNENNIGYLPVNQSIQRASTVHKATRPNYNESFFISHERAADHPDVLAGTPLRGRNQWPEGHAAMRAAMVAYFTTLQGVGERMLPVLARALGMPADHFAPSFAGEAHINLRFLHYPPQDIADDEQFGQGPHTDNSFITILARMDVPGLAVRLPSGEWLAPPLIPGTFLVNLGNMMKRWSNDRFLSTPHAVLNESGSRPLLDRVLLQPDSGRGDRVPAELHGPRRPAALSARGLRRPGGRVLPRQLLPPERPPANRSSGSERDTRGELLVKLHQGATSSPPTRASCLTHLSCYNVPSLTSSLRPDRASIRPDGSVSW